MGMFKKLVLTTAAVAGGLYIINHGYKGSVHTFWKRTTAQIEKNISPEFELERIKDQIAKLTPDMHRNISKIAEEMVEVKTLENRVGSLQAKLSDAKGELKVVSDAIEHGNKLVSMPSGREIKPTATLVRDKLHSCKNIERELTNSQKILEAKQKGLDSARLQLAEMKRQREELMVMAADFEAELKTLQLEQTRAKLKLDDTRLGEIKQAFEALRARIEVERTKADETAAFFRDATPAAAEKKADAKDTLDEARSYLNGADDKSDTAKK
ncbi:MAG: hypothetical protein U0746_18510 [Gemmataceae bacterium]